MHPAHVRAFRLHRIDAIDRFAVLHQVEAIAGNEPDILRVVLQQFLDARVADEELPLRI